MPAGAVYVGRPTRWGNPWYLAPRGTAGQGDPTAVGGPVPDRAEAVRRYRRWLAGQPALVAAARRELAGRALVCWCPLDRPCHAEVLWQVANAGPAELARLLDGE
jgi:hypothetical protein